jgi:hypothetical protein
MLPVMLIGLKSKLAFSRKLSKTVIDMKKPFEKSVIAWLLLHLIKQLTNGRPQYVHMQI